MSEDAGSGIRVVIIDDEKKIVALIKKIVDWCSLNCQVIGEAYNGKDGLDLVKSLQPDIVLADIKMPGLDGISLMRETKNEFPEICFIFISGHNEFEYAQSALNLGAIGYTLKPIDKQEIESLIIKGITHVKRKLESNALKQGAESFAEDYFGVFDSFINKKLYAFFDSNNEERLITAIKLNNRQEAIDLLEDIFTRVEDNKLSMLQVKKIGMEICTSYFKNFFNELNRAQNNINFKERLKGCLKAVEIKEFLCFFTESVIEDLNNQRSNSSSLVIDKVKRYIAENICNELSLNSVSQIAFMNPTYFSEFFKKETGENFVEYVTKYRLNIAKELLRNTEMKMNDISNQIGYRNLNYFYKVFKKHEGVTPKEYRKIKGLM